jgi:hypothetical protein
LRILSWGSFLEDPFLRIHPVGSLFKVIRHRRSILEDLFWGIYFWWSFLFIQYGSSSRAVLRVLSSQVIQQLYTSYQLLSASTNIYQKNYSFTRGKYWGPLKKRWSYLSKQQCLYTRPPSPLWALDNLNSRQIGSKSKYPLSSTDTPCQRTYPPSVCTPKSQDSHLPHTIYNIKRRKLHRALVCSSSYTGILVYIHGSARSPSSRISTPLDAESFSREFPAKKGCTWTNRAVYVLSGK